MKREIASVARLINLITSVLARQAVIAARRLLAAEELANPASYPVGGKLETFRDIGRAAADIDRLVTDLKSAK